MISDSDKQTVQPPESFSDAEIIKEIIAGKRVLLNELYNRYASRIYYKCLSIVKETNLAQDMCHDVFIKVSLNLHKYKGTADLSFWIYAITYNHCITYLRKEKRIRFDTIDKKFDSEDYSDLELTEKNIHDLKLTQLKKHIKKLKPDEEIILLMRYQDGMSVKQIATILQIGESAVKMRLKRCRDHLAELLNDFDHE